MDLTKIIESAAWGFGLGFASSFILPYERFEEGLDLIELLPNSYKEFTIEKFPNLSNIETLSNEKITSFRSGVKKLKKVWPLIISLSYIYTHSIVDVTTKSGTINPERVFSIPFAYLGSFSGKVIRPLFSKKSRELKFLKKLAKNPEHIDKYLLSKEDTSLVNDYLLSLWDRILAGDNSSLEKPIEIDMIFDIVGKVKSRYSQVLFADLIKKKIEKITVHAEMHKEVASFYSKPCIPGISVLEIVTMNQTLQELSNNSNNMSILDMPTEPNIRVFSKQKNSFYIDQINIYDLEIPDDYLTNPKPPKFKSTISSVRQDSLLKNHKKLTDCILEDRKNYVNVLFNDGSVNLTGEKRTNRVLDVVLPGYVIYLKKHEKKKTK